MRTFFIGNNHPKIEMPHLRGVAHFIMFFTFRFVDDRRKLSVELSVIPKH